MDEAEHSDSVQVGGLVAALANDLPPVSAHNLHPALLKVTFQAGINFGSAHLTQAFRKLRTGKIRCGQVFLFSIVFYLPYVASYNLHPAILALGNGQSGHVGFWGKADFGD